MVQTAAAKNRRRSAIIGDKKSSLFWHMMMIHTQLKLRTTSSRTTQPKFYDHQGTHHQKLIQSATIGQLVHWCEFRKSNTTLRVQQCHFEITRKTADLRTNTIMSLETPENDLRTRDQTRWAYQRNFNRPMSILLPGYSDTTSPRTRRSHATLPTQHFRNQRNNKHRFEVFLSIQ